METIIKETRDYSIFDFSECNRPISNANLLAIKLSIQKIGYSIGHPVTVRPYNNRFVVIDGQHRIKACEDLNIPVPYVVENKSKREGEEAMVLLNNAQAVWTTDQWISHYAIRGFKNYITLVDFKYRFNVGGTANLLALTTNHTQNKKFIKEGTIGFIPNGINNIKIALAIKERAINLGAFDRNICLAIAGTSSKINEKDLDKLIQNAISIKKCGTKDQYIELFQYIINKNKKADKVILIEKY